MEYNLEHSYPDLFGLVKESYDLQTYPAQLAPPLS